MHIVRAASGMHLPIPRKGTKYIAVAANHQHTGITVVAAVRDILGLAKTSKEVQHMVTQRLLKVNGKVVKDIHLGIRLGNVLEADKKYVLKVLPTGRFGFAETKKDMRLGKVVGKKVLPGNKIQIHLHDGTCFNGTKTIAIGDSVTLDLNGKVKDTIKLEKGKRVLILSGSKIGKEGKVVALENSTVQIQFEEGITTLEKSKVMVIA